MIDPTGERDMTVGEFWIGKIGSGDQARGIIFNASASLFALGVIAVIAGIVLSAMLIFAGALYVALAFAVRLTRNPIVIGVIMALFVVAAGDSLYAVGSALAGGATPAWSVFARLAIELTLLYVLYRAFQAARFLKAHPADAEASPDVKVLD